MEKMRTEKLMDNFGSLSLEEMITSLAKANKVRCTACFGERSSFSLFEPDVVLCSASVTPLQHRSCFVCMSFVRLGHYNE